MAALVDQQIRDLILATVGDPDGALAGQIDTLWDAYADKAAVAPRLRQLYVTRHCLDLRLGAVATDVDFHVQGLDARQDQVTEHLREMRGEVQTEILAVEARARALRAPAIGAIAAAAPTAPPYGRPDSNDPRYSGSPYIPLPGPWR